MEIFKMVQNGRTKFKIVQKGPKVSKMIIYLVVRVAPHIHMPPPGYDHIFTGLQYSGASVPCRPSFPVVQFIGLQYSVLGAPCPCPSSTPLGSSGQPPGPFYGVSGSSVWACHLMSSYIRIPRILSV